MKDKLIYTPALILTLITIFAGTVLSGASVAADTTGTKNISVTVGEACGFTVETEYTVSLSVAAGTSATTDNTKPTFSVTCTSVDGISVQAIGSSPDGDHPTGHDSNTFLYGGAAGNIPTSNESSATGSFWAFKVTSISSNTTYLIPGTYASYSAVPSSYQDIIQYTGLSSGSIAATLKTDYKVSVVSTQTPGSYTGAVKYKVVSGN